MLDKKILTERDICSKFISPALMKAGWNNDFQIREEVSFTDGRIYVRGKLTTRGKQKRADYILYYKSNIPVAIIEAKDNSHNLGDGMQQALEYARILDIPCVFSSNGDGFLFHDRTIKEGDVETSFSLDEFPSPESLWHKYKLFKGIVTPEAEIIVSQDYYEDGSGRSPRYYQQIAVNRTVEAIAKGENRILLVMATGTGKTYTAFQIGYRLWKAGVKKRILFLADRTALIDQTRRGDFKHFRDKMTVIKKKVVENNGKEELVSNKKRGIDVSDKAYEIFLGLYQGLTDTEGVEDAYKDFSPDFFDLIIIDECHRGSAAADSSWRQILDYFKNATHIGLTATPRETAFISNSEYFGDPIYTYSLKQGIYDGFLAPYKVFRVGLNVDLEGWRPPKGFKDKEGNEVEDRIYQRADFDRNIVIEERRKRVANKITEFLRGSGRFNKTIVFCVDIEHAEAMRHYLVNCNADLVLENPKYIMRITGDNDEGKRELDNFINPEEKYPVIATTSKLMTTGVDAQTCKLIVLDSNIQSMTEFKQIIGRGTRINEEFGKQYFTILDFRDVTRLFADRQFDGDPVRAKELTEDDDFTELDDEDINDEEKVEDEKLDDGPEKEVPKRRVTVTDKKEREKIYVSGVDVTELVTREVYFDAEGKPVTMSLKDYSKQQLQKQFTSLDQFLTVWNAADKKAALIKELEAQGILLDELQASVNNELDVFDLICHVAYDQPPLTRKERANNVKKRNYFAKYGEGARRVLETLLDKYADEGIENIESMEVLKVKPLDEFGSPIEIIKEFENKDGYMKAVKDLESELYKTA